MDKWTNEEKNKSQKKQIEKCINEQKNKWQINK
jgi:hypothetical protein